MNNRFNCFVGIAVMVSIGSCDPIDKIDSGCSVRISEQVFEGEFDSIDIEYIGIIDGVTQKTLYPLPDWEKSNKMIVIRDPVVFDKFKNSMLVASFDKAPPTDINVAGNVQILVSFKKGPGAYLFCRPANHDFGVSPMFASDSYGMTNGLLFDIINDEVGKAKKMSPP